MKLTSADIVRSSHRAYGGGNDFLNPLRTLATILLAFNQAAAPYYLSSPGSWAACGRAAALHVRSRLSRMGSGAEEEADSMMHELEETKDKPESEMEMWPDKEVQIYEMDRLLTFALNLQEEQNWKLLQKKSSMMFSRIAQSTYVAPSRRPDAGLGLFASRDLEQDEIATLYPVHGIGWKRTDGNGTSTIWLAHPEANEDFRAQDDHANSDKVLEIFHDSVRTLSGACVDVDPLRADVAGWLGHRVNDAAVCSSTNEKAILKYLETVARERNVAMVPFGEAAPIMAVVTTRAIRKDEELFYPYGYDYWLGQAGIDMQQDMYTPAVIRETDALQGMILRSGLTELQEECWETLEDEYEKELDYLEDLLCRHYDSTALWKHLLQRRIKERQRVEAQA